MKERSELIQLSERGRRAGEFLAHKVFHEVLRDLEADLVKDLKNTHMGQDDAIQTVLMLRMVGGVEGRLNRYVKLGKNADTEIAKHDQGSGSDKSK